mmetsp:Transcript_767/g.1063  ORF Transcript_767/g.1063 Transcript_767/m.1063 type:complete len:299 (-) Transcript_767:1709-2605(-)
MAATKLLANTLKKVLTEPVEGFTVELADEDNLFEWKVYIEGPKDTPFEGGVFQLLMKFPPDYPMSPPELRFVSDFWHPNVYKDTGIVCISILHPPVNDEMSGELPEERWRPTQTVSTILLSVISLLSAPNFSSPANVDASVEWRKNPEEFKKRCEKLVQKANKEKPDHVVIPHPDTNPEERERQIQKIKEINKAMEDDDIMYEDNVQNNEESSEDEVENNEDLSEASSQSEEKKETPKQSNKKTVNKDNQTSKKSSKSQNKTDIKSQQNTKKSSQRDSVDNEASTGSKKSKKKKCIIM